MTDKPKILVTGAAGKTGSAVTRQLLADGYPVRAFVRSKDQRADVLEKAGAEIFVGNLAERDDLMRAMSGVKRAYFVVPPNPHHYLYWAMAFAVAAADSKLESVVAMSQWLAQPQHPSAATRQTW